MKPSKKKGPEVDTQKQWEIYFSALKNQEWAKALSVLNILKEAEPQNPNVHLKIGDLLQRTGDVPQAIAAYHQAAWNLLGSGFHHKAVAIYKVILRLDPDDNEAVSKTKEILMEMESPKSTLAADLGQPVPQGLTPEEPAPEWPSPEVSASEWQMPEEQAPEQPFQSPEWPEMQTQVEPAAQEKTQWELDTGRHEQEPLKEEPAKEEVPSLFATLSREEIDDIISRAELITYNDGEAVIHEGDSGDSMFIIKEGRARVVAHILGRTIELATLEKGDVFGEVAFLTGRPRTASVIAAGFLSVIEINRLIIEDVIEGNPAILARLQDFYQSRVQDTIKKVKGSKG